MAAALLAQNPLEEHDYKFAIFAYDRTGVFSCADWLMVLQESL